MLISPVRRFLLTIVALLLSACLVRQSVPGLVASMEAAPRSVAADGVSAITVSLHVLIGGAVLPDGVLVWLESSDEHAQITQPARSDAFGNVSGSVRCDVPGVQSLSAYLVSAAEKKKLPVSAAITFTAVPAPASVPDRYRSALSIAPSNVVADGVSLATVRATLQDSQGSPVKGEVVSWSGSGSNNLLSASQGMTDANGLVTITFASTHAEAKTVTATTAGFALSGALTFTPGSPDAAHSLLTSAPTLAVADGNTSVLLTAHLADAYGNDTPGVLLTFSSSGMNNALNTNMVVTDGSGRATASLKSTKAETKMLAAAAQGLTLNAMETFIAGPPVVAQSSLSATITSGIPANNANSTHIAAVLRDQFANPVPSYALAFDADNTHSPAFARNRRTLSDGSCAFDLTSQFAGPKRLNMRFNAQTMSAAVTFSGTTASCSSPSSLAYDGALPMVLLGAAVSVSDLQIVDMNKDGIQDLIFATGAGVQVALGRGHARFSAPLSYAAQPQLAAIESCDMNRDGNADVVTYTRSPGSVSVYLGSASGALGAPTNANTTSGDAARFGVACADVTGDGNNDVIATTYTTAALTVFAGDGQGGLDGGTSTALNTVQYWPPTSIAMGDVTEDGNSDAVIAAGDQGVVLVFPGNGNGGWSSTNSNYQTGVGAYEVHVADLNGDGKLDIIVPNSNDGTVKILLNQGGGIFPASAASYAVGAEAKFARTGDLNGDGKVDLAVVGRDRLFILLGHGDGTFGVSQGYREAFQTKAIGLADLDADGVLDVAGAGSANGIGNGTILLGKGDGSVAEPAVYPIANSGVSIDAGDVTGDSFPDIVAVNTSSPYQISIFTNAGDGTFAATSALALSAQPQSTMLLDLDGDEDLDIVAEMFSASGGLAVFSNTGNGTFGAQILYPTNGTAGGLAFGDFSSDGVLDLATANQINSSGNNSISVLLGAPAGGFAPFTAYTVGSTGSSPTDVSAADLNLDGALDLVVALQGSGQFAVLLGAGDGTFTVSTLTNQTNATAVSIVGDYNLDGYADAMITYPARNLIALFPGQGNGSFGAAATLNTGGSPLQFAVADFNEDGKPDLMAAEVSQASVTMLLTTTGTTLPPPVGYLAGNAPGKPAAADFNQDGFMDFALVGDSQISVYLRANCQ